MESKSQHFTYFLILILSLSWRPEGAAPTLRNRPSMEALQAAATVVEEVENPGLDPDDTGRGQLPSDDEEGPPQDDEDDDEHDDDDAMDTTVAQEPDAEQAAGERAADADDENGARVEGEIAAPELPVDLKALKVDELKVHLWWRALPRSGLKADLLARLEQAVKDNVPVRTPEQAATARGAGDAAPPAAVPKVQWEPVDADKIERPAFEGSEQFTPRSQLNFKHSTHPFEYMNQFYPKEVRDLEVENSEKYRGYVKMMGKEVYPRLPDISPRTNSLAHAMLLLQGANPVPDQRKMFTQSFFYKAHRGSDCMTREEWKVSAHTIRAHTCEHERERALQREETPRKLPF